MISPSKSTNHQRASKAVGRSRKLDRSSMMNTRVFVLSLLLLLLVLLPTPSLARTTFKSTFRMPKEDPYKVLGIKLRERNNLEAIKKAYRQKAKDSHPDKNPDLDPTTAADNFRRIVDAWEFLSNPQTKRMYDSKLNNRNKKQQQQPKRMYTSKPMKSTTNMGGGGYQHFTFNQQQKQQKNNQKQHFNQKTQIRKDAKIAQDNVLKLSTVEQFHKTLLDRNQRYKKHFLCVFVAGKKMEHFVDNDLLFPYPFGPHGRNQMDWTSILQTAKVRYNKPSPLTQTFRVPHQLRSGINNKPYIVFAKKGDPYNQFKVYKPQTWSSSSSKPYDDKLERWVLEQLTTPVTIVNHYHSPISVYIQDDIDGLQSLSGSRPIPPDHQTTIQSLMGDRIVVLDTNMDQFPGGNGGLKSNLLQNDNILAAVSMNNVLITEFQQTIDVGIGHGTTRRCYDLSVQCPSWATTHTTRPGSSKLPNCKAHLDFAHTICPYSCGVCIDSPWNGMYYGLFHYPLHKVPTPVLRGILSALRSSSNFVKTFLHDLGHLFEMRRNVTFLFVLAGFLGGLQIVILGQMITNNLHSTTTSSLSSWNRAAATAAAAPSFDSLGLAVLISSCMIGWGVWMSQAHPNQVPFILRGFQRDLVHMVKHSMDAVYGLAYLGFLSMVLSRKLVQRQQGQQRQPLLQPGPLRRSNHRIFLFFCLALVSISLLLIKTTTYVLGNDMLVDGKKNHRFLRWSSIWQLRKTVALSILILGYCLGMAVMELGRLLLYLISKQSRYLGLSILNGSLLCFGIGLALKDRYFLKDLEHVLSMRMSAAIPCAIHGMMWGVGLGHVLSNYQVKVKVD